MITTITHDTSCLLDIVWISSHCGLQGNKQAEKLAKLALQLPLCEQLAVADEFHDAKAAIRRARKRATNYVDKLPDNIQGN